MNHLLSTENIGLLSLALLVIGFIKFILYYKYFNIPIIEYIETSEIITLFTDNIITGICVTLFLIFPYYFIIIPYLYSDSSTDDIFSILIYYIDKSLPFLAINAIIVFLIVITLFKRDKIYGFELFTYIALFPIITLIIPIAILIICVYFEVDPKSNFLIIISMTINFCIVIFISTFNEIRKVKKHKYYSHVSVAMENELITSNTDFYYVGKTKSHIFFYRHSDKSSCVYPINKLKYIEYRFKKTVITT